MSEAEVAALIEPGDLEEETVFQFSRNRERLP
jgi:hypothetical protein